MLYNADQIIAAGGDIAISPDNIDVSDRYLMINEDGTTESRAPMAAKSRDGSIWRFNLTGDRASTSTARKRVVELDSAGRDGRAVGPGVWETSGIIDGQGLFGKGSWLFDVQAHAPTVGPGSNTVEDGPLLLLEGARATTKRTMTTTTRMTIEGDRKGFALTFTRPRREIDLA